MTKLNRHLVLFVVAVFFIVLFQNCSNAGFGVAELNKQSSSSGASETPSTGGAGETPNTGGSGGTPGTGSSGGTGTGGGITNALNTQTPGTWTTLTNSKMSSVIYSGTLASSIEGNSGAGAIMNAWNGGTLDTISSQLLIWGGGHGDYWGNEVYSFSLNTLKWTRVTDPSDPSTWSGTTGVMPDGKPAAPHTYDGEVFLPNLNKMFFVGGMDKRGYSYNNAWLFDANTKAWTRQLDYPCGDVGYGQVAAFDSNTGHVFVATSYNDNFCEFDPIANKWKIYSSDGLPDYHMSGDIDPIGNRFVAVGAGRIRVYALSGVIGQASTPATTGDRAVELNGNAPGFVWYPPGKVFVGWDGGSNVYTLDPTNWKWTLRPLVASNKVTPTAANGNGTFGRFQYDPVHNIFIVVNGVDENVYFYKPNF